MSRWRRWPHGVVLPCLRKARQPPPSGCCSSARGLRDRSRRNSAASMVRGPPAARIACAASTAAVASGNGPCCSSALRRPLLQRAARHQDTLEVAGPFLPGGLAVEVIVDDRPSFLVGAAAGPAGAGEDEPNDRRDPVKRTRLNRHRYSHDALLARLAQRSATALLLNLPRLVTEDQPGGRARVGPGYVLCADSAHRHPRGWAFLQDVRAATVEQSRGPGVGGPGRVPATRPQL